MVLSEDRPEVNYMAKKKTIKIHPEIKSTINTFFAGFLPVFLYQIQDLNVATMEAGVLVGILVAAFRMSFKYGIAEVFKWIVAKLASIEIK